MCESVYQYYNTRVRVSVYQYCKYNTCEGVCLISIANINVNVSINIANTRERVNTRLKCSYVISSIANASVRVSRKYTC